MIVPINSRQKRQVIDITDKITKLIPDSKSGTMHIFVKHTTAAITTADLDPGTDLDFLNFLKAITPGLKWRHPHNPAHAPDHFLASLIGPSILVPIEKGELGLGTWQRIVMVELDGPRERHLVVSLVS